MSSGPILHVGQRVACGGCGNEGVVDLVAGEDPPHVFQVRISHNSGVEQCELTEQVHVDQTRPLN